MRSWGSWVSEIRAPNQKARIWLGSYSTPEAAARAYDAALLCLKGPTANLNFPTDIVPLPAGETLMSPKSIQRVAAAAAIGDHVKADTVTTQPVSWPSSVSASSSSPSSPSNQQDDDTAPATPSPSTMTMGSDITDYSIQSLSTWIDLDVGLPSPKSYFEDESLIDHVELDPNFPLDDFLYEECDIGLWSFS